MFIYYDLDNEVFGPAFRQYHYYYYYYYYYYIANIAGLSGSWQWGVRLWGWKSPSGLCR